MKYLPCLFTVSLCAAMAQAHAQAPSVKAATAASVAIARAAPAAASAPASTIAQPPSAPAATAAAATAPATEDIRVLLLAEQDTTLSSPATARIVKLNATTGAAFTAGQQLVAFDCDEPTARLRMSEAELTAAQETLDGKLRMQGLAQASEVEVALASSAVAKGRAQVALNSAQVAQCSIKAPWAGRIARVHVRNFMSVTPGQPLLDIVKSGPLRIKLNLPSRLVGRVRTGTPIEVTIDETGKNYEAKVLAVNSRIDTVSQTVEVEAAITRLHAELLPGMSGVAHLDALR